MNSITPEQALANLATVTEPQNIPRLSRADFVNVNQSLIVLEAALKELAALKSATTEAHAEAGKP